MDLNLSLFKYNEIEFDIKSGKRHLQIATRQIAYCHEMIAHLRKAWVYMNMKSHVSETLSNSRILQINSNEKSGIIEI